MVQVPQGGLPYLSTPQPETRRAGHHTTNVFATETALSLDSHCDFLLVVVVFVCFWCDMGVWEALSSFCHCHCPGLSCKFSCCFQMVLIFTSPSGSNHLSPFSPTMKKICQTTNRLKSKEKKKATKLQRWQITIWTCMESMYNHCVGLSVYWLELLRRPSRSDVKQAFTGDDTQLLYEVNGLNCLCSTAENTPEIDVKVRNLIRFQRR